jgi:hypothetical protein
MGFETEEPEALLNERDRGIVEQMMAETKRHAAAVSAALTSNRDLLAKVRRFGLQKI